MSATVQELIGQYAATSPDDVEVRARIAVQVLDELVAWRKSGGQVTFVPPHNPTNTPTPLELDTEQQAVLRKILQGMDPAFGNDETEILRLAALLNLTGSWVQLPREVIRSLLAMVVARLRRLQDERRYVHSRLESCFSAATAFSKREQPGYVVGLARRSNPVRNTWEEDAIIWWELLQVSAHPRS